MIILLNGKELILSDNSLEINSANPFLENEEERIDNIFLRSNILLLNFQNLFILSVKNDIIPYRKLVYKNKLVKFTIKNDLLDITSTSEEGAVKVDIIMDKTGGDLEIGFNSNYMMDALKAIEDEQIKMRFNTAVTPCVIQPVEGDSYEYLVLPVRIPTM